MKACKLLLILLLLSFPAYAQTTYYVDAANGHDDSTGTSEAGAWASLSKAADTATTAGDLVYVQGGTSYTAQDGANGCVLYIDSAGVVNNPIVYEGYTTTPGDNGVATLNAGTNTLASAVKTAISGAVYYVFKNLRFTGGSGDGFDANGETDDSCAFYDCQFDTNSGWGMQGDNYYLFVRCIFNNNTVGGLDLDSYNRFLTCKVYSNTGHGLYTASSNSFVFNVFYDNGDGAGADYHARTAGYSSFIGNSFDGDNKAGSVGIKQDTPSTSVEIHTNNIFYDLAVGIEADGNAKEMSYNDHNFFYSNGTDRTNVDVGDNDVTGSGDPFTASATRDYTLKADSEALAEGMDGGSISGGTSYNDIGSHQQENTGGGSGGLLAGNKRGNKE